MAFPEWVFYPRSDPAPEWVEQFIQVTSSARSAIDSASIDGLTSDRVLGHLRPGLEALGYEVETGKRKGQKVRRPVLFGDRGTERVAFEVDAANDELGIVVEIEAGRGARGNAVYRDLVRTSLIIGARYLVLGVMQNYRHRSQGRIVTVHSYEEAKSLLDAIYASGRLTLPFDGMLLFGY